MEGRGGSSGSHLAVSHTSFTFPSRAAEVDSGVDREGACVGVLFARR